jgi:F-box and WD-40 domain protein 1/11
MSLSLPWGRRKSSLFNLDDPVNKFRELSVGTGNDAGSQTVAGPSTGEPTQRNLKGIFRRASVSVKAGVKGIVHRRTSVPAIELPIEHDADVAEFHRRLAPYAQASQQASHRPTTSQSTWHRLRQATSFHRHSRFLHTGYDDRMFDLEPIESPTFPVPGSGEQPPIIPRNTGAAARQAAASSHNDAYGLGDSFGPLVPKPNWLAPDEGLHDYESGIGIAVTSSEMEAYVPAEDVDSDVDVNVDGAEDTSDISKVDFISELPTELAIQILAYLDAAALANAQRVSKRWNMVATNQHIWRESFLREKTTTYATSGRVQPGTGMGVPTLGPQNNWREIYRVKEQLDKRWKEGKARPVYLNGHSDSIYCLQFDEYVILLFFNQRLL